LSGPVAAAMDDVNSFPILNYSKDRATFYDIHVAMYLYQNYK